MKNELGRKITTKFVGLRAITCSYLTDYSSEEKKEKGTKKFVIKKSLNFRIIKAVQEQLNLRIK